MAGIALSARIDERVEVPMHDDLIELIDPASVASVKRAALDHLEQAFANAEADGIPGDAMAHAALFAALQALVERFGEDNVADLARELPERIEAGAYTTHRVLQ